MPSPPVVEAVRVAVPMPSASKGSPEAPTKFGPDWVPPAGNGPVIEPVVPAQSRPEVTFAAPTIESRVASAAPSTPVYRVAEPVGSAPPTNPTNMGEKSPAEEDEDLPYSAASRLGGLRTLLVSLGLKALNKESEFQGQSGDEGSQFERNAERPVYAEPITFSPEGGSVEMLPPDAASVKAKPEFLPPKPALESPDREKEPVRPTPKRLRWDAPEDVETLPSWRWQYRKRR